MAEIRALTRQVPVDTLIDLGGGDTIRVSFDRNAITPHLLDQMGKSIETGDVLAVARMLEAVIISWDVTDEGQPFPPSAQNIGRLSVTALAELSRRIGDAAVPSDAEGNASGSTSSTPSSVSSSTPANLQNGQEPSPSQSLSESPSPR